MSISLPQLGRQVMASGSLLARRPVQIAIALAAIATLLSVVLAPEATPSTWDWVRIIIVGLLGACAVLSFAAAKASATDSEDGRQLLLISGVLVAIAIVLNLTFSIGTTVIFSVGITAVAILATEWRDRQTPWIVIGALIAAIPFWVWSALEAWTWLLVLLAPLAAIGVISDGHMRAAVATPPEANDPLSPRSHRLACWTGILVSALLALVAGMLTDAADGVVALGAVGAMLLVALEAGTTPDTTGSSRRSPLLADAALLWIALCWIVSL
jgi:hypothetical protein